MKNLINLVILGLICAGSLSANNQSYQTPSGVSMLRPGTPQAQFSVNGTGLFPLRGLMGFGSGLIRIWTRPQSYNLQKYNVSLASTYFFGLEGLGITLEMGGGQSFQQVQIDFMNENGSIWRGERATVKRAHFDMMLLAHYGKIINNHVAIATEFGWFYSYGMNAQITALSAVDQQRVREGTDFLNDKHNHGPAVKVGIELGQMFGGFYAPIGYMIRYNFGNGWLHGFYLGVGYKITS